MLLALSSEANSENLFSLLFPKPPCLASYLWFSLFTILSSGPLSCPKSLIVIETNKQTKNISKLPTEAQDLFSTEFSSAFLTLLHAKIQS